MRETLNKVQLQKRELFLSSTFSARVTSDQLVNDISYFATASVRLFSDLKSFTGDVQI